MRPRATFKWSAAHEFVNHDPKRQHLSEKKMVENGST
jgi:hypothetical protein